MFPKNETLLRYHSIQFIQVIEERKRDRHLLDDDKGESIMGLSEHTP